MSKALKDTFNYVKDLGIEAKMLLTTNPLEQWGFGLLSMVTYGLGLSAIATAAFCPPAAAILGGCSLGVLTVGAAGARDANIYAGRPIGTRPF